MNFKPMRQRDITGKNEMKRFLLPVLCLFSAMIFMTGCGNKEITQSFVYKVTVEFSDAAGKQVAMQSCDKLYNKIDENSAVLVYAYVSDSNGEKVWTPLPCTIEGILFDYVYTDNGIFVFSVDAGEGMAWNKSFSQTYKIIQIPQTVYAAKLAEGVNHDNYHEVMKEYQLYESVEIQK